MELTFKDVKLGKPKCGTDHYVANRFILSADAKDSTNEKRRVQRLEVARGAFQTSDILEPLNNDTFPKFPVPKRGNIHGLLATALTAYAHHLPLSLRPDDVYQAILEGFAVHVNQHAEELREHFVPHKDKKDIIVRRDDFVKGSTTNKWEEVFPAFTAKMKELMHADALHAVITDGGFSTTTPEDRLLRHITMMDVAQKFFRYIVFTKCGFPKIRLEGTRADWVKLYGYCETLRAFMTKKFAGAWIPALLSIIQKFVDAFDDKKAEDHDLFWQSMCKFDGTRKSGARAWITGWINVFYPYVSGGHGSTEKVLNECLFTWEAWKKDGGKSSTDLANIGFSCASAPFTWLYLGKVFNMEFKAGIVGSAWSDGWLKPCTGWAVTEWVKEGGEEKEESGAEESDAAADSQDTKVTSVSCDGCGRRDLQNGSRFYTCVDCEDTDFCVGCHGKKKRTAEHDWEDHTVKKVTSTAARARARSRGKARTRE